MSNPILDEVGDVTKVGDRVRVESAVKRIVAVATEELLADEFTAAHYAVGQPDSLGKPIVLGEEFTYLAHGGTDTPRQMVTNVYHLVPIPEDEQIEGGETERFVLHSSHDNRDDAIAAAVVRAIELEA